ncbi:MAG: homoserine dehydrogenase [Candidatus Omnitrophica bacterium]|nr:homoserine dehydrogenase [Candidatus Omnitrophota bacterium]
MRTLRLGLLGLGQVGGGLYQICSAKRDFFIEDIGVRFDFKKIAVKNKSKKRSFQVPKQLLTTDAMSVVRDPEVDVVVELIGGTREAYVLVTEALKHGKHVVTANKALLAEYGDEIFALANKMKRWVFFEASVGGGIPVIKALREGLVANRLDSIHAIINGTSNYILTQMTENGKDFKEALAEAQQKGYAEADPALDIEGVDAAHKLAILVRFGFGGRVKFSDISCEGITRISSEDIAFADEFGYRIKLLAIAKKFSDGIEARVQPTLLPAGHMLASVQGSFNAVMVHGDEVGDVLFYGRGAGSHPTASAVLSDLVDLAMRQGSHFDLGKVPMRAIQRPLKVKSISAILSRYYLRFHIVDRPGVLAKISEILGKHQISISDVIQKERSAGSVVPLILLTHDAAEKQVRTAIQTIDKLEIVRGKSQVLRIEGNS